jgi:hypothetical protein
MAWYERWRRDRRGECRTCGARLVEDRLSQCGGREGDVEVVLSDVPVRGCLNGHERRYLHPDFGPSLIDALFYQGQVPVSTTRFLDRQVCCACGARVGAETLSSIRVEGSIAILDLPAFGIVLSGPGTCCSRCRQAQIFATRECASQVAETITRAFEAAHLRP